MVAENPNRPFGIVTGTSGLTCTILIYKEQAGGPMLGRGCRHVDDPDALRPTFFEDVHYYLYRLADSELDIQTALRQSAEAVEACQEFARMLAGTSGASEKRPRGRPKNEPIEADDAA